MSMLTTVTNPAAENEIRESAADFIAAHKEDVKTIMGMMGYMRPAFSEHDKNFCKRFLEPLGAEPDVFGNYILRIGTAPIMWSCHTDTVHHVSGFVTPLINKDFGYIVAGNSPSANCLGADCTAGVWLMCEMIAAGVEGLYIFHREEERGAKGSKYIVDRTPELVENIEYAVAFDRHSTDSVITHQMCDRCCSEEFGIAFSSVLEEAGMEGYKNDDSGVYTDTAYYTKLISECTNISVGYYNQHCKSERQDVVHLIKLRDALVKADFSKLPIVRDKTIVESKTFDDWFSNNSGYGSSSPYNSYGGHSEYGYLTLLDVIEMYPRKVAALFREQGFTGVDLMRVLEAHY